MALADVYDALISKRVYKPAFSHDKAKQIIQEGAGQHFDPEIVDAFLAIEARFVTIAKNYKDKELEIV
jgi:response regulator RpfG family c-di-GMP phosphodiesterase